MKKNKFSNRTKSFGITTIVLATATTINIIKDQAHKIITLNNQVQDLYNKAFYSLTYELELESFIVNRFGEEVLQSII